MMRGRIIHTAATMAAILGLAGFAQISHAETRSYQFAPFTSIEVAGLYHVQVTVGEPQAISATAEKSVLDQLDLRVKNGVFIAEWKSGPNQPKGMPKLEIRVPKLTEVDFAGAIRAEVNQISGKEFVLDAAGAGQISLTGKVKELAIDVAGATVLDTSELKAEEVEVDASGAAKMSIHAEKVLEVDMSGASQLTYSGNPAKVVSDVSGAANLKRRG